MNIKSKNMIYSPVTSLFKATRRTIVAEVTLMIVIVISFSWSAYALYKLFSSGSETLFGYSFSSTPQQLDTKINNSDNALQKNVSPSFTHPIAIQHHQPNNPFDHQRVQTSSDMDENDLEQQLSNHKKQILNELLNRQRRLFEDARANGRQDLMSLLTQNQLLNSRADEDGNKRSLNIVDELQRWKGGYKLPTSLDYLFENKKPNQRVVEKVYERPGYPASDRMPLSSINSHSTVAIKSNLNAQQHRQPLVHLTDAPSLMQLAPKTSPATSEDDYLSTTTTPEPRTDFHDDQVGNEDFEDEDQVAPATTTTTQPPQLDNETTTESPSSAVTDGESDSTQDETMPPRSEDPAGEKDEQGQQEGTDTSGDKSVDSDQNEQVASDEPMERVRNASRSIDEDVDRMTQPSLGMTSRQEKPALDYKNTVQFDDGPTRPSSIGDILAGKLKGNSHQGKRQGMTDLDIVAPIKRIRTREETLTHPMPGGDLLVADNLHKTPISTTSKVVNQKAANLHRPNSNSSTTVKSSRNSNLQGQPNHYKTGAKHGLLHDYDGTKVHLRRSKRSIGITNHVNQVWPMSTGEGDRKVRLQRRYGDSDGDDNDNDDESDDKGNGQEENQDSENSTPSSKTSDSPTLQELLAHKQLLDALQQSQLPPPLSNNLSSNPSSSQDKATLHAPITRLTKPNQSDDHQSAGTHYSVDHGLLLYPASDEEHEHKSMSHKSGKSSKKKGKKKMTLAVKKGGHKNKKHKKEEKKYIKEKKFKGAKKGKKMSKGKGGKGGKKGKKFYKDKGFKKKGFKNIYVKNEFGQKKSYFDEFRDKDFKKKWKNFDDKYNYAQMKKWQAKDVKGAKKMKDQGEDHKKYDKGKWNKNYHKHMESEMAKKKKKKSSHEF